LVTAATLMLQIIETRIISVISWYHLAFFVISIAMFGLTAGAVFVYLRRESFRPEQLSYDLAVAALAFALTTDLAMLVQLTLVTGASPSLTSLVAWAEFALCLAVPFFFSGVVVSLALTRSPYAIGNVYGADLIGAAAGCIGVLVLLNVMSGPSAVLWSVRSSARRTPPTRCAAVLAPAGACLIGSSSANACPNVSDAHCFLLRARPTFTRITCAGRSCVRSLEFVFPHHRQSGETFHAAMPAPRHACRTRPLSSEY
jgi:hypothetical protein